MRTNEENYKSDAGCFSGFPKMARLSRECIITEKIDGTNGQILITPDGRFFVGSRTRWITPQADNFGFATWANAHRDELVAGLGIGRHFGEWWGRGIQRNYGLSERRFSLFNAGRWCPVGSVPQPIVPGDPRAEIKLQDVAPACCSVVPVLYRGKFDTEVCEAVLTKLRETGSLASPWFEKPEGIVVWHLAGNVGFKKTIEDDEVPKSRIAP
jgi:hypothetical protein